MALVAAPAKEKKKAKEEREKVRGAAEKEVERCQAALDDATRASALEKFRAAFVPGGDAAALLASLADAEEAALAACATKLNECRRELTTAAKRERAQGGAAPVADGTGARKPTVIIVGGGAPCADGHRVPSCR